MEITEVHVFPVDEPKLKAYVTMTLDRCFLVRDIKVIDSAGGLFVAMPSRRRKDGTYKDVAHPLNAETREKIETVILDEYEREIERRQAAAPAPAPEEARIG